MEMSEETMSKIAMTRLLEDLKSKWHSLSLKELLKVERQLRDILASIK